MGAIRSLVGDETRDFRNTDNDIIDVAITEEKILCVVRCLKNGKASGEDEIINEHIKTTVDILLPFYVTMFNKMFDTGIIPDTWLNGVILHIYIQTKVIHHYPIMFGLLYTQLSVHTH